MPEETHAHSFRGLTSYSGSHHHGFTGTSSDSPDTTGHVHYITGLTSRDAGHDHRYSLATGPAVKTDYGHFHYLRSDTSLAAIPDTHAHLMDGNTSVHANR